MKQQFTIVIAMLCFGLCTIQAFAQAALVDGLKDPLPAEIEKTNHFLNPETEKGPIVYDEASWEPLADSLFATGIELVIFMLPSEGKYTDGEREQQDAKRRDFGTSPMRTATSTPLGSDTRSPNSLSSSEIILQDSTKALIQRFNQYLYTSLVNSIPIRRLVKHK